MARSLGPRLTEFDCILGPLHSGSSYGAGANRQSGWLVHGPGRIGSRALRAKAASRAERLRTGHATQRSPGVRCALDRRRHVRSCPSAEHRGAADVADLDDSEQSCPEPVPVVTLPADGRRAGCYLVSSGSPQFRTALRHHRSRRTCKARFVLTCEGLSGRHRVRSPNDENRSMRAGIFVAVTVWSTELSRERGESLGKAEGVSSEARFRKDQGA